MPVDLISRALWIDSFKAAPPALLDGLAPTGAYSFSRNLLTTFSSAKYTATGSAIDTLVDQSGNSRTFTGTTTARPTLSTAGSLSRACADFNGTSHVLIGPAWQSFVTPTTKFIAASVIFDSITSPSNTTYYSTGHWVIGDDSGLVMLNASNDTSADKIYAASYNGSVSNAAAKEIAEGVTYVVTLRHDSGSIYAGVNGDEGSVSASTTTTASNSAMKMGFRSAAAYLDGKIFEVVTFNTVPTLAQRNALIADMVAWVGSPPYTITSYNNPGGKGNRTSTVTITGTVNVGAGTHSMLVNGNYNNEYWWGGGTLGTMRADFGVGASKVCDEYTWHQDVGVSHGSWKAGGSNDGTTITLFPEAFTLGDVNGADIIPFTNATGYRYYHLVQQSGSYVSTPYIREWEFKIRDA